MQTKQPQNLQGECLLTKTTNKVECEVSCYVCPCFHPGALGSFITQHASLPERLSNLHQAGILGKYLLNFTQSTKRPYIPVQLMNPPGLPTETHVPTRPVLTPKSGTEGKEVCVPHGVNLKARRANHRSKPPETPRNRSRTMNVGEDPNTIDLGRCESPKPHL